MLRGRRTVIDTIPDRRRGSAFSIGVTRRSNTSIGVPSYFLCPMNGISCSTNAQIAKRHTERAHWRSTRGVVVRLAARQQGNLHLSFRITILKRKDQAACYSRVGVTNCGRTALSIQPHSPNDQGAITGVPLQSQLGLAPGENSRRHFPLGTQRRARQ